MSLFYFIYPNLRQSFRKTNERSLRYLKTDGRTDGQTTVHWRTMMITKDHLGREPKHHIQWFDAHYLTKASCNIAGSFLKDFRSKVRKSAKTHKSCIIMLINPSWYNFLEKIIFNLQITIDRLHPVQILRHSHYCITTHIM